MDKMEMWKNILSNQALTVKFVYSDELEEFVMRMSLDGEVLGIATVPEYVFAAALSSSGLDFPREKIQIYPNEETS